MKFYKVNLSTVRDSSLGALWFTSKRYAEDAAEKFLRSFRADPPSGEPADATAEIEEVHIVLTKTGLLKALRYHASHPDNG